MALIGTYGTRFTFTPLPGPRAGVPGKGMKVNPVPYFPIQP